MGARAAASSIKQATPAAAALPPPAVAEPTPVVEVPPPVIVETPPKAVQPRCKVLHEYTPTGDGEIALYPGEIVDIRVSHFIRIFRELSQIFAIFLIFIVRISEKSYKI